MKLKFVESCLVAIVFCLTGSLTIPAQSEFAAGEIIEKVAVKADAAQSYALYLPKNYTPGRKWPILYAFDPVARGKLPVAIFREAAERYGYIVAGSNNSQNGLDGPALSKILSLLWDDTHRRLAIDERRVYTTGFSGGSRVAVSLAASCGCVAGVIGNGAGFPSQLKPAADLPFIYFNAIGVDDYNYYEIAALRKDLTDVGLPHRIERFDAAHQWLTEQVAGEALAWMQLHAMKKGIVPRDEKFIEDNFRTRLAAAEGHFAKRRLLEAFESHTSIAADFSGLKDVADIDRRIREWRASDNLRKALREEEGQLGIQRKHAAFILSLGAKFANPEEKIAALSELRNYLGKLQRDAEGAEDGSARRIARRALDQAFAQIYEAALYNYERSKKYAQALISYEIANEIYPKNPRIPYDRARVYALDGQTNRALEFLEKAVGLGFKNWPETESEKAFEKLRREEKFKSLLANMKTKQ